MRVERTAFRAGGPGSRLGARHHHADRHLLLGVGRPDPSQLQTWRRGSKGQPGPSHGAQDRSTRGRSGAQGDREPAQRCPRRGGSGSSDSGGQSPRSLDGGRPSLHRPCSPVCCSRVNLREAWPGVKHHIPAPTRGPGGLHHTWSGSSVRSLRSGPSALQTPQKSPRHTKSPRELRAEDFTAVRAVDAGLRLRPNAQGLTGGAGGQSPHRAPARAGPQVCAGPERTRSGLFGPQVCDDSPALRVQQTQPVCEWVGRVSPGTDRAVWGRTPPRAAETRPACLPPPPPPLRTRTAPTLLPFAVGSFGQ